MEAKRKTLLMGATVLFAAAGALVLWLQFGPSPKKKEEPSVAFVEQPTKTGAPSTPPSKTELYQQGRPKKENNKDLSDKVFFSIQADTTLADSVNTEAATPEAEALPPDQPVASDKIKKHLHSSKRWAHSRKIPLSDLSPQHENTASIPVQQPNQNVQSKKNIPSKSSRQPHLPYQKSNTHTAADTANYHPV